MLFHISLSSVIHRVQVINNQQESKQGGNSKKIKAAEANQIDK